MIARQTTFYLTVNAMGLEVRAVPAREDNLLGHVRTYDEFLELVSVEVTNRGFPPNEEVDLAFICSGKMAHPDRYTTDETVVGLCRQIRSSIS